MAVISSEVLRKLYSPQIIYLIRTQSLSLESSFQFLSKRNIEPIVHFEPQMETCPSNWLGPHRCGIEPNLFKRSKGKVGDKSQEKVKMVAKGK